MTAQPHFDRRGANYDHDAVHQRIVSLLIGGAQIKPGFCVLDIATGTGLLALKAARLVGPEGELIGLDLSKGMLAEAHRKAAEAKLRNIEFTQADAEHLAFPRKSFDAIFCSSGIVLMSDIPRALRHWSDFLKTQGIIAFDTPAKPFGISQRVAEIAAEHGVRLTYADVADTPGKCRSLLEGAGFEAINVGTERVNSSPMELGKALAFYDERLDHPAWQALKQASQGTREAVRSQYVDSITAAAVDGYVANDMALNFSYGRKPA